MTIHEKKAMFSSTTQAHCEFKPSDGKTSKMLLSSTLTILWLTMAVEITNIWVKVELYDIFHVEKHLFAIFVFNLSWRWIHGPYEMLSAFILYNIFLAKIGV